MAAPAARATGYSWATISSTGARLTLRVSAKPGARESCIKGTDHFSLRLIPRDLSNDDVVVQLAAPPKVFEWL